MKNNTDDFYPNGKENSETIDPNKLAYILLARKILTPRDFAFMDGRESFADWKQYNKNMVPERIKESTDED